MFDCIKQSVWGVSAGLIGACRQWEGGGLARRGKAEGGSPAPELEAEAEELLVATVQYS